MHTETAEVAQDATKRREPTPLNEWRALWALEDGQPAWLRDSVAILDGYLQGEMGHS